MPAPTPRRRPSASLWPPAARWREHLCMFVVRDTRACALGEAERLNRFPANPYCCITWMLEGRVQLVGPEGRASCEVLPRRFVHGCRTRPCVSRNLGDRHSFCAVFHPDAFRALFGVDLASIQDAFVDVAQVLPPHGLRLVEAVADAGDDGERQRLVEDFLAEHATATGAGAWARLRRMGINVGLALAGRVLGVGPRQVQRLARRDGGLNVPGLSRLWRGERSLRALRGALARGEAVDWAAHAAEAGYADQSHLVRDCKAISGRTPARILAQAARDEADWVYRLPIDGPVAEDR